MSSLIESYILFSCLGLAPVVSGFNMHCYRSEKSQMSDNSKKKAASESKKESEDDSGEGEGESSEDESEDEKAAKKNASRDDLKLQYYIQLFEKQAALEERKNKRKQAREQRKQDPTPTTPKQKFQGRKKKEKKQPVDKDAPLKIELIKDMNASVSIFFIVSFDFLQYLQLLVSCINVFRNRSYNFDGHLVFRFRIEALYYCSISPLPNSLVGNI